MQTPLCLMLPINLQAVYLESMKYFDGKVLLPSNRCLDPNEVLSRHKAEELDRVVEAYSWLVDDDFVRGNLAKWLV